MKVLLPHLNERTKDSRIYEVRERFSLIEDEYLHFRTVSGAAS